MFFISFEEMCRRVFFHFSYVFGKDNYLNKFCSRFAWNLTNLWRMGRCCRIAAGNWIVLQDLAMALTGKWYDWKRKMLLRDMIMPILQWHLAFSESVINGGESHRCRVKDALITLKSNDLRSGNSINYRAWVRNKHFSLAKSWLHTTSRTLKLWKD